MRRGLSLAVAVLALLAATASPASARVPRSFFGVVGDGPLTTPGQNLDAQAALMRKSHVGVLRTSFYWDAAQPDATKPPDFSATDAVVLAAARHGIDVLPVVLRAPSWARQDPADLASPPADPATYQAFLSALVTRYGPNGSLWTQHPDVPQRPIRRWQIWNEPDLTIDFKPATGSWPGAYVTLAKAARSALKQADPGSTVTCAGLTNRSWVDMASLYKAGIKGVCDQMAIHPYSHTVSNVLTLVELNRRAMRRAGDGKRPLLLSELTWTSGEGKSTTNHGWETTEAGQAAKVRQLLPAIVKHRVGYKLAGAYWYTWLSPAIGQADTFQYSGLLRLNAAGKVVEKPALGAYRQTVARLTR